MQVDVIFSCVTLNCGACKAIWKAEEGWLCRQTALTARNARETTLHPAHLSNQQTLEAV